MMGIPSLLSEEMDRGLLVAPFETAVDPQFGYYLVYREVVQDLPRIQAFRAFLLAEVDETSP